MPYFRAKLHIPEPTPSPIKRPRLFRISAKDEISCRLQVENLRQYVEEKFESSKDEDAEMFLDRLAFTLNEKRSKFPWNRVVSASSTNGLVDALASESTRPQRASQVPRIGFVFSGQGAQWYAMGRELIGAYPVFRKTLEEADECLRDLGAEWSLLGKQMMQLVKMPALMFSN